MTQEAQIEDGGRVLEATMKQIRGRAVFTNERGDELWRFFDGDDGKRRWKVWAVERTDQTTIKNYRDARPGATYFEANVSGRGEPRFVGTDYIIPKKYLMRIAGLLGLKLHKGERRPLTKEHKKKLLEGLERFKASETAEKSRAA